MQREEIDWLLATHLMRHFQLMKMPFLIALRNAINALVRGFCWFLHRRFCHFRLGRKAKHDIPK